jgi:two-component system sensor histidine kinase/response regulator
MPNKPTELPQLLTENEDLRARLDEAEETLRAIRNGEVDALFVSGVDKMHLYTLKDADQYYRTLIEDMSEGALILNEDGVILYTNRSFAKMIKMPLEKVIGARLHSFMAPESQPLLQSLLSRGADEKRREQLDLTASDGTRVTVYMSVNSRRLKGVPDALSMVVTDLTEQKQIEAIVAAEKSKRKSLAAAMQSSQQLLSVIEDQKQAEESLRQSNTELAFQNEEKERREAVILRLNAELESKVLARTHELERAKLEAETANQSKSSFLSNMSHEIRTPMNGVIGMLDVLQQSSLNAQQLEMTNIIHESANSLLSIINDILDFSKIEAGKFEIDLAPMSVADVVVSACASLDNYAAKKSVELTLFTDPAIPAALIGDAGRLRQILINLINNAVKFSSGQPRLGRVSVRAILVENTSEQAMLEFRITDNGIGMDEQTQAMLFTAFTQADSSTSRTYGGTGLGLTISQQLVNLMGSTINVVSEPDKGSVFSVRLPLTLPPTQPAATPSLIVDLPCLLVGGAQSMFDDLDAYLAYDKAVVERTTDKARIPEWIARQPPGLCLVIIDAMGNPLDVPLLDELRAAASAHIQQQTCVVVIGRGRHRAPRLLDTRLTAVDGNNLSRKGLLNAVALALGLADEPQAEGLPDTAKVAAAPLSREAAKRQGRLILVAEDNEINQKVILQQLALLGQIADIVNDGREALEMWHTGDYALLFSDLNMPQMDGYELAIAIRAAEKEAGSPQIPVIAFTANAIKGEMERCLAIGMDDYLCKPVQLVNLKATLEKWLPQAFLPQPELQGNDLSERLPGETLADVLVAPAPAAAKRAIQAAQIPVAVDLDVLKALVGEDEAFIRVFLHDFKISARKIATELRAACTAGRAEDAGVLAHKLKSSALSVGALVLGEMCAEMENAGKAGDMAALKSLVPRFDQELGNVDDFLEEFNYE